LTAGTSDRPTQILAAACRVIARQGIHDLRVEDVAREIGVSPALVYYYFHTRDELLGKAFEFADARSSANTFEHMPRKGSAADRLEYVLTKEIDDSDITRENWIIWSETSAAAVFDPVLRSGMKRWSDNWVRIVADLVREGQADGSIPVGVLAEDAAERLTAVVDSLGTKWLLGGMSRRRTHQLIREALAREFGVDGRLLGV
jgi:AcrR family transcriptional regulator